MSRETLSQEVQTYIQSLEFTELKQWRSIVNLMVDELIKTRETITEGKFE